MKINWKIRLQNKTFLVTFATAIIAFVYQIVGILGLVPPVSEDLAIQLLAAAMNMLIALGVVVDPTTMGLSDSARALRYDQLEK